MTIVVDMTHMTPQLLADAGELLGMSVMEALQGPKQPLAIAALAAAQHDDLTFDVARLTDLTEFEIVNQDADPEARGASNGATPRLSPVTGR